MGVETLVEPASVSVALRSLWDDQTRSPILSSTHLRLTTPHHVVPDQRPRRSSMSRLVLHSARTWILNPVIAGLDFKKTTDSPRHTQDASTDQSSSSSTSLRLPPVPLSRGGRDQIWIHWHTSGTVIQKFQLLGWNDGGQRSMRATRISRQATPKPSPLKQHFVDKDAEPEVANLQKWNEIVQTNVSCKPFHLLNHLRFTLGKADPSVFLFLAHLILPAPLPCMSTK